MEQRILRKSYKILGLSFLILIFSLIFFLQSGYKFFEQGKQLSEQKSSFQVQPLTQGFRVENSNLKRTNEQNLPVPNKFSSFTYTKSKPQTIKIQTKCADDYYAVLIFKSTDDYRQNPASAKFNRAFPCQPGQIITKEIDLSSLNLADGVYYYFVADQGREGGWYNPH